MILSIIVPTYNVESYLSNCLNSLISQDITPEDYEIIVINDGSTDSSPEIAISYEKKYSQLKVIHQKNQGLSAARNKGIQLAKGKYIFFVDSDDYIAFNTLGYALDLMHTHDLQVLGFGFRITPELTIHDSSNYDVIGKENIRVTDGVTYVAENNFFHSVWWYIINREYLVETGLTFPVGRYIEDCNFTAHLLTKSKRITNSSIDVYRYVDRPGSIMNKRAKEHFLKIIGSHEQNTYELQPLLDWVNILPHDCVAPCLNRLKALQHFYVFQLLVSVQRARLSRAEIEPILDRLTKFGVYPIHRIFLEYNNNLAYILLRFIMNRKLLLINLINLLSMMDRILPNFHLKVDRLARNLASLKN